MVKNMWYLKNFDELSKKEVIEIYKARIQTFIVEQQLNYQEIDEIDKRAWHLFETDENGKVIAYLRIFQEVDGAHIGRVIVDEANRRQGKGTALMERAIEICQEWYVDQPIMIHAQTYLQQFYESLGFEVWSQPYQLVGIEHMDMILK